jgi:hypothetical protein
MASDASRRSNLGHYNQIHPTLHKYILLRRSLAGQQDSNTVKEQSSPPEAEVKPVGDATEDSKPSLKSPETDTGEHMYSREGHLSSADTKQPQATRASFYDIWAG